MLQGSLENFALDEVLGLLSGTSKTGQLEISGNRGTGTLTFNGGRLVDGTASYTANGTGLEDVMFELLRYDDGTFTFASREVTQTDNLENVATVLASAEHRLRDWRSIEAGVPSLNHQIAPTEELPEEEVTITRAEWAALTVIAAGCPVSLVCDRLELGEVEGSRQIKNLAERGLISVTEPIGSYISSLRSNPVPAPAADVPAPLPVVTSPAVAYDSPAPVADVAVAENGFAAGSENGTTSQDRPPMPAAPAAGDLVTDDESSDGLGEADAVSADTVDGVADDVVSPAPPSPAEISSFSDEIEDASELVSDAEDTKGGGLLARYLKSDD